MTIPSHTATRCDDIPATVLFAGLATLDVLHRLDHVPDPSLKVTSAEFTMVVGSPAADAAVTCTALCATSRIVSDSEDKARAASGVPADFEEMPILLTALGGGSVSAFLAASLAAVDIHVMDTTAPASSPTSCEPTVSSIIEHPNSRMVASTNTRLDTDAERVATDLPEWVGAVLTNGHNSALAHTALTLGVPEVDEEDPFTPLETHPPHPHILDGGSWKKWLTPSLSFVDITVVPEDFALPLMTRPGGAQVTEFLRGFGAMRTVCTRGDRTVQYWWDGANGEIPVEAIPDASTLGADDAFYGALVWAIEYGGDTNPERLIRFASSVAAVSVSSFGTRQWLTSRALAELVRGW